MRASIKAILELAVFLTPLAITPAGEAGVLNWDTNFWRYHVTFRPPRYSEPVKGERVTDLRSYARGWHISLHLTFRLHPREDILPETDAAGSRCGQFEEAGRARSHDGQQITSMATLRIPMTPAASSRARLNSATSLYVTRLK